MLAVSSTDTTILFIRSVARAESFLSMIEEGCVRRKLVHISLEETRCGMETVPRPVRG
jgi:hypothetical protein